MQVIEKTPEGKLTEEQSERFMLGIALVTKKAFTHFAELSPEDILQAFRKPVDNEAYTETINKIYQDVLEADMPQVFNDYIQSMAINITEKAFQEVAKKSNDNLALLISKYTGIPYEDLSPKDVLDKLKEALDTSQ